MTADLRAMLERLRQSALEAAAPFAAVRSAWPTAMGDSRGPVHVLATGKASLAMAQAAADLLGPRIASLIATTPPGIAEDAWWRRSGTSVYACDHPYPTERNVHAAEEVGAWMSRRPAGGHVLALISGGASAHLCLPAAGLSLDDVVGVSRSLMRAGATIREINCVRKHIEQLKGGRLAQRCSARTLTSMILSDVLGDPLDVVSSGPTVPDPTTFAEALNVLSRRGCEDAAPAVRDFLQRGARGEHEETPKSEEDLRISARTCVIASNARVVEACAAAAARDGFAVVEKRTLVEGEARDLGVSLAGAVARQPPRVPAAIIWGGEPTVTVTGPGGRGGPSQELALAFLAEASEALAGRRWGLLALSTDGRDGPSDGAGAVLTDEHTSVDLAALRAALDAHDTQAALARLGALIPAFASGTNLNHVYCVLLPA
ncbi:MAG TPA: DUF4147 domain-containing protein [Phycisphaerales bacterium]|nr:DUF4147 domain-containing protein [Phycisphaerales bacterium]